MTKVKFLETNNIPSFDEVLPITKHIIKGYLDSDFGFDYQEMLSDAQERYLRCLGKYSHFNKELFLKYYKLSVHNACKNYVNNKRREFNFYEFLPNKEVILPSNRFNSPSELTFYFDLSPEAQKVIDVLFDPPEALCTILQQNKTHYSPLTIVVRFVGLLMGFGFPRVYEIKKEIKEALLESL